jgi:hypothetical protein
MTKAWRPLIGIYWKYIKRSIRDCYERLCVNIGNLALLERASSVGSAIVRDGSRKNPRPFSSEESILPNSGKSRINLTSFQAGVSVSPEAQAYVLGNGVVRPVAAGAGDSYE